jgi:hypothetical protein
MHKPPQTLRLPALTLGLLLETLSEHSWIFRQLLNPVLSQKCRSPIQRWLGKLSHFAHLPFE